MEHVWKSEIGKEERGRAQTVRFSGGGRPYDGVDGAVESGGFFPPLAAPARSVSRLGVGRLLRRPTSYRVPLPHLLFIELRDGGPPAR
jgi:hypothetical protein